MKLYVFAVRDSKSDQFGNPMFLQSSGVFLRSLSDEINKNQESVIHQHPDDFEAFALGEFDTTSGRFDLLPAPQSLVTCASLKVNGKG